MTPFFITYDGQQKGVMNETPTRYCVHIPYTGIRVLRSEGLSSRMESKGLDIYGTETYR